MDLRSLAAVLALNLVMTGCASAAGAGAPPPDEVWGAPGHALAMNGGRGVLEESCSRLVFGPVSLDSSGRFSATGELEQYAPGPQPGDSAPATVPVTVNGTLKGETMDLTIAAEGAAPREVTLIRGRRAKIFRCL
ncbi:hypothetical protein [Qipengyuania sp.]|uniref:hypothetical protein n=1 Tax=Qipengyuania sp. TaxID=2004515 RepID=UPI0035C852AC